ncbi:hypothetical protein ACFY9A_33620 [Streptomyces rubradiris]
MPIALAGSHSWGKKASVAALGQHTAPARLAVEETRCGDFED